jgi:dUTPase
MKDSTTYRKKMNKIYLLNTNPRAPKKGNKSNTFDVFFLLGKEDFEIIGGRTYCMPTGLRMFTDPNYSQSSDIIIAPRSSSSLIEKTFEREHEIQLENGITHTIKSYPTMNLRITNTIGYIDWEYRSDIQVRFCVDGLEEGQRYLLSSGKPYVQAFPKDASSQLVVVSSVNEIPKTHLSETQRMEGGFGSTD